MRGLTITVIFIALANLAQADTTNLRPLQEVIQQEQSPAMLVYFLKRCSGAYTAAAIRAGPSQDPAKQLVYTKSQELAGEFVFLALQQIQKAKLPDTAEAVMQDATDIAVRYSKAMQESYLSTGNALSEDILSDMRLCSGLLKQRNP